MFKTIKTLLAMCPICEAEKEVQYGTNEETLTIKGEKIDVVAKVFYCPKGNHFFSNLEDDEEKIQYVYREYRKRKKLLQPEEIKQIREKYNLSQEAFSLFLGFGRKTIHRYETGAIPDDPHNSFIKLIHDTENFKNHFENIKDKLPDKLKQKIEKLLLKIEIQPTLPYTYAVQIDTFLHYYLPATTISQRVSNAISHASWIEPSYERYNKIVSGEIKTKITEKELAVAA